MDIPYLNCDCTLCQAARPGPAPRYCAECGERPAAPGGDHCDDHSGALTRLRASLVPRRWYWTHRPSAVR